jgi:hypothetical protein
MAKVFVSDDLKYVQEYLQMRLNTRSDWPKVISILLPRVCLAPVLSKIIYCSLSQVKKEITSFQKVVIWKELKRWTVQNINKNEAKQTFPGCTYSSTKYQAVSKQRVFVGTSVLGIFFVIPFFYLQAVVFLECLFFFKFPNLFAICNDTFRYIQQMVCWEARAGRGVLCSTPPQ